MFAKPSMLTRIAVGLMLVPHGLRICLGFFPGTGGPPARGYFAVFRDCR